MDRYNSSSFHPSLCPRRAWGLVGKATAILDDAPDPIEEEPAILGLVVDVPDRNPDHIGAERGDGCPDQRFRIAFRHQIQNHGLVAGALRGRGHATESQGEGKEVNFFRIGGDQEYLHRIACPRHLFFFSPASSTKTLSHKDPESPLRSMIAISTLCGHGMILWPSGPDKF